MRTIYVIYQCVQYVVHNMCYISMCTIRRSQYMLYIDVYSTSFPSKHPTRTRQKKIVMLVFVVTPPGPATYGISSRYIRHILVRTALSAVHQR